MAGAAFTILVGFFLPEDHIRTYTWTTLQHVTYRPTTPVRSPTPTWLPILLAHECQTSWCPGIKPKDPRWGWHQNGWNLWCADGIATKKDALIDAKHTHTYIYSPGESQHMTTGKEKAISPKTSEVVCYHLPDMCQVTDLKNNSCHRSAWLAAAHINEVCQPQANKNWAMALV